MANKPPKKKPAGMWQSAYNAQRTPAEKAASTAAAGQPQTAQVTSPTVAPFLTGQDLVDLSTTLSTIDLQLGFTDADGVYHPGSIDTNLADLGSQTAIQKDQTDKTAKENSASATDNAIARGLFQSSIKDATLFDIEAQRAIQQKFLDDRLSTATINANTQKSGLGNLKTGVMTGFNTRAVENAKGIEPTVTTQKVAPMITAPQYTPPKTTKPPKYSPNDPISDGGSPGIGRPTGQPPAQTNPTTAAAARSFSTRSTKRASL